MIDTNKVFFNSVLMQINRNTALILALITAIIYGVSFTVAKDVMPKYILPYGFILLRVIGATILFWLSSLFIPKQKIVLKDFGIIILAAIFGVALNMLTFFKGLSLTSPISGSVIMLTTPILVLTLSHFFLKEKASKQKLVGIFIGLIGAVFLIIYGKTLVQGENAFVGNLLVFVNAVSYAFYLIIIKKLTSKYHPIHLAKWIYFFGLLLVMPFAYKQLLEVNISALNTSIYMRIGFIVVFTTFVTYLFNLIAIKKLKPTTVSIFIYLQPLFATIYALGVGSDKLNIVKITAATLICIGVYLVTKTSKKIQND